MANHIITLTSGEETIYAEYLIRVGTTDAQIMARLKQVLADQVTQTINEAGHAKFNTLSAAAKIAFLES